MLVSVVAVLVIGSMMIETRRAAGNERLQRARGGIEPSGDVYKWMQVAYPAAFLAMLAEGAVRGVASPSVLVAGAALFVAAKALKWWAITTLGPAWTFRVIVVPGDTLVASGPYRFVRHPNYAAVVGELAAVALMMGARLAGPIAAVGFLALLLKRIVVEERALDAILPPIPSSHVRDR